ncbi:hypothetical protein G6F35_016246 [Rhizopus arrhizus]|nr:hypothetical protein G6F35_016246 [Rhizopus arrhizus]
MAQHNASEQDIIFISDDEIIVISDDDDDDDIFFTAPNSPTIQTTAVTTKPPTLLGINDRLKALRISREPSKPLATNHTIPERASSRHRIIKHPIGNVIMIDIIALTSLTPLSPIPMIILMLITCLYPKTTIMSPIQILG